MKKILALVIIAALSIVSNQSFAQVGWVKQKVDEKISLKFPKQPEGESPMYKVMGADSTVYVVSVTDLATMGLDSATLATMAPTEEFAEQFKTGLVGSMPGAEITKVDIGTWKGLTTYSIEGKQEKQKLGMFMKCIFIGSKMYTIIALVPNGVDTKNKDTYIDSVELN